VSALLPDETTDGGNLSQESFYQSTTFKGYGKFWATGDSYQGTIQLCKRMARNRGPRGKRAFAVARGEQLLFLGAERYKKGVKRSPDN